MAPLHAAALVASAPYVLWLVFAYDWHLVDGANLLFHEAGHVVFGLLGETIGMLGGTLAQLLIPALAALHFLREGQRFEACLVGIWLGENGMNVARYLGDAREMALPLVGGGIHDWNWLLTRMGLLEHCTSLARLLHLASAACVVAAWLAALQAARRAPGHDAEAVLAWTRPAPEPAPAPPLAGEPPRRFRIEPRRDAGEAQG